MFFCLIAKKFPINIVRIARRKIVSLHRSISGRAKVNRITIKMNAEAPLEITDRKDVTLIGAPS
jgi:hypothetical protein